MQVKRWLRLVLNGLLRVPVVVKPLHERRRAVPDTDDRHPHLLVLVTAAAVGRRLGTDVLGQVTLRIGSAYFNPRERGALQVCCRARQLAAGRQFDEHVAQTALGAEAAVARHDHGAALVAGVDELEEQVGAYPIDWQVADLVDHQQRRRSVDQQVVNGRWRGRDRLDAHAAAIADRRDYSRIGARIGRPGIGIAGTQLEATLADRRNKLVPVIIEQCDRPIIFELTHTTDLSKWDGSTSDPSWRTMIKDLGRLVDLPAAAEHRHEEVLS